MTRTDALTYRRSYRFRNVDDRALDHMRETSAVIQEKERRVAFDKQAAAEYRFEAYFGAVWAAIALASALGDSARQFEVGYFISAALRLA